MDALAVRWTARLSFDGQVDLDQFLDRTGCFDEVEEVDPRLVHQELKAHIEEGLHEAVYAEIDVSWASLGYHWDADIRLDTYPEEGSPEWRAFLLRHPTLDPRLTPEDLLRIPGPNDQPLPCFTDSTGENLVPDRPE